MCSVRALGAWTTVLVVVATMALMIGCGRGPMNRENVDKSTQALTTCTTLHPSDDALLSNPPMDQGFGNQPLLRVGGKDESIVRFDLGTVPHAAAIDSAMLRLFVRGKGSDNPIGVHRATAAWNESAVTYASFAQRFESSSLGF